MTAVLVGDFAPGSDEWRKVRMSGIGASEIAAVMNLSPFESAFSMWHRKKGNIKDDANPDNPLFWWGHELEPLVAKRFAMRHPEYEVQTIGTYRHDERQWQIANLDRLLVPAPGFANSLLEIKTTRYGDGWGTPDTEDIPLHVRCQVMQQMDVFSYSEAWVAVLIAGSDYREYLIKYDEHDARLLRAAGDAFWRSLDAGDEPPIDMSHATYQAVRELHPHIDGSTVEVPAALAERYHHTKVAAARMEDEARAAKSELLNVMGNARYAAVAGNPVARRQPGRGGSVNLYAVND